MQPDNSKTALTLEAMKVLVVDDEPFMLNAIVRVIRALGVREVEVANDGLAALAALEGPGRVPDVVICDLKMPGTDGVEVLRRIGEREISTSFVIVSGMDGRVLQTVETLAASYGIHLLGALPKPVERRRLEAVLRSFDGPKPRMAKSQIESIGEEELRGGIERDQLTVEYQPKVFVRKRKVLGVEALARWKHPTRGPLSPGAFIPIAEESGQIEALTFAVLTKALRQAGKWRAAGVDLSIAVNVCVDSLKCVGFPKKVLDIASAERVDPTRIVLEVTESRLMENVNEPLEVLTRLRLRGVQLAIDDFGTGYSSLEQLRRIPFTELKVDRAFVNGASVDPTLRALLESSVDIGKKLGLSVVAEGVETQEDWRLVTDLGCDIVQGFGVARPMAAEKVERWVAEWERVPTAGETITRETIAPNR